MQPVAIPTNELNEFDLPRVCVVTGERNGVVFKNVKFSWYPPWVAVFILVNVLVAAVIALILTKRVKGQLPFTEEAYARWRRGQLLFGLSFVALIGLLVGSGVLMATEYQALGGLAILAAIAVPIVAWVVFARNTGPKVTKIDDVSIYLNLPSAGAAEQIEQHLHSGVASPRLPAP
jgi:hypothetical protein